MDFSDYINIAAIILAPIVSVCDCRAKIAGQGKKTR